MLCLFKTIGIYEWSDSFTKLFLSLISPINNHVVSYLSQLCGKTNTGTHVNVTTLVWEATLKTFISAHFVSIKGLPDRLFWESAYLLEGEILRSLLDIYCGGQDAIFSFNDFFQRSFSLCVVVGFKLEGCQIDSNLGLDITNESFWKCYKSSYANINATKSQNITIAA